MKIIKNTFDYQILAAQRGRHGRVGKGDERKAPERVRYENVHHLAIGCEKLLQVVGGNVLSEASDEDFLVLQLLLGCLLYIYVNVCCTSTKTQHRLVL